MKKTWISSMSLLANFFTQEYTRTHTHTHACTHTSILKFKIRFMDSKFQIIYSILPTTFFSFGTIKAKIAYL